MENKTAVEWLIEQLEKKIGKSILLVMDEDIQQALEMEKKQMIDFADDYVDAWSGGCNMRAEQYYSETFKKPESEQLVCNCGKPYHERDLEHGMCHQCWQPTKEDY